MRDSFRAVLLRTRACPPPAGGQPAGEHRDALEGWPLPRRNQSRSPRRRQDRAGHEGLSGRTKARASACAIADGSWLAGRCPHRIHRGATLCERLAASAPSPDGVGIAAGRVAENIWPAGWLPWTIHQKISPPFGGLHRVQHAELLEQRRACSTTGPRSIRARPPARGQARHRWRASEIPAADAAA